jgi:hypothetical protein
VENGCPSRKSIPPMSLHPVDVIDRFFDDEISDIACSVDVRVFAGMPDVS